MGGIISNLYKVCFGKKKDSYPYREHEAWFGRMSSVDNRKNIEIKVSCTSPLYQAMDPKNNRRTKINKEILNCNSDEKLLERNSSGVSTSISL